MHVTASGNPANSAACRAGAPLQVIENLQEIEDPNEAFEGIEEIWPDYPDEDEFFFNDDGDEEY